MARSVVFVDREREHPALEDVVQLPLELLRRHLGVGVSHRVWWGCHIGGVIDVLGVSSSVTEGKFINYHKMKSHRNLCQAVYENISIFCDKISENRILLLYTVCPRYNAPRYNAESGITRSTVAPEN